MSNGTDSEYVGADELSGGLNAAEGSDDFRPPLDVLVALRPFGRKTVDNKYGKDFEVIEVYVVQVTEDGGYVDIGLRDVGWEFVMRELDKATNEAPWIVGTITKKSRAYFLVPPTVDDMKRASVAIDDMLTERRNAESAAEEPF